MKTHENKRLHLKSSKEFPFFLSVNRQNTKIQPSTVKKLVFSKPSTVKATLAIETLKELSMTASFGLQSLSLKALNDLIVLLVY